MESTIKHVDHGIHDQTFRSWSYTGNSLSDRSWVFDQIVHGQIVHDHITRDQTIHDQDFMIDTSWSNN